METEQFKTVKFGCHGNRKNWLSWKQNNFKQ